MKLTILGASSAVPTRDRNPSGQFLESNGSCFLIDCGEGTQKRLKEYRLKFSRINHIFISHLHGDHYLGLMGLLSTLNLYGRKKPLHIYAYKLLDEIIQLQIKVSEVNMCFELIFHHLEGNDMQILLENEKIVVKSFPLFHRVPTYGFLFIEKPGKRNIDKAFIAKNNPSVEQIRQIKNGADFLAKDGKLMRNHDITIAPKKTASYAYASDTEYNEKLISFVKNIGVLYHETTFLQKDVDLAHKKMHATTTEAARIAKASDVDLLITGHYSTRYNNSQLDDLLMECKKVFPNTVLGYDGKTFEL